MLVNRDWLRDTGEDIAPVNEALKGQCHEIFSWISLPQAPEFPNRAVSFFRKFAEILAAQGAPSVSSTPVADGKNLKSEKF